MAFVEERADEELYDEERARRGYVPNFLRALSQRPDVYRAWMQLNRTILGGMDERRYELATLAAARRLRSSYCSLAHGKVLAGRSPRLLRRESACAARRAQPSRRARGRAAPQPRVREA
jgi:alkylhydroperoxidase family enzyme